MAIEQTNRAAQGGGTAAADAPQHRHSARGRHWAGVLAHRWPAALGVMVAALLAFDLDVAGFVPSLASLVVLLALVYVGAAVVGRRRAAWVVLLAGLPVALFFAPASPLGAAALLLGAAVAALLIGAARGHLRRPGNFTLQAAGMLTFGATALAILQVAPGLGAYVAAFALLGHAAWDAAHYLRDRVVARSYAEFCGTFDLLLGISILILA
jgi:hypothetical protein